ncbi:MAG: hypothetical protein RIE77_13750 [Phycisphaerales bacterium]|jgi:hypothetical protein
MRMLVLGVVIALASRAVGQPAITIEVDQPVLMPSESTTITLWAGHDPSEWAMAFVETDFVSSQGARGLSDWRLVEPMNGPGTQPGSAAATGIEGILAGQLNCPPCGTMGTNPIAFWSATYTAPSDVLPLDVRLSTLTSRFDVYPSRDSVFGESRLGDLVAGEATIRVVPAPAGALVIGSGVLLGRRRR